MDEDSSSQFLSSLSQFIQTLLQGYSQFDHWVRLSGSLYFTSDAGHSSSLDFVIDEKIFMSTGTSSLSNPLSMISSSFCRKPTELTASATNKYSGLPNQVQDEKNCIEPIKLNLSSKCDEKYYLDGCDDLPVHITDLSEIANESFTSPIVIDKVNNVVNAANGITIDDDIPLNNILNEERRESSKTLSKSIRSCSPTQVTQKCVNLLFAGKIEIQSVSYRPDDMCAHNTEEMSGCGCTSPSMNNVSPSTSASTSNYINVLQCTPDYFHKVEHKNVNLTYVSEGLPLEVQVESISFTTNSDKNNSQNEKSRVVFSSDRISDQDNGQRCYSGQFYPPTHLPFPTGQSVVVKMELDSPEKNNSSLGANHILQPTKLPNLTDGKV